VPNGFEPDAFRAAPVDRGVFWHEQLVAHRVSDVLKEVAGVGGAARAGSRCG
jgi:hypothetical protein